MKTTGVSESGRRILALARIGKRIRARRKVLGLTQTEVAAVLNHSRGWLEHVENGRRALTVFDVRPLANHLGIDVLELLP